MQHLRLHEQVALGLVVRRRLRSLAVLDEEPVGDHLKGFGGLRPVTVALGRRVDAHAHLGLQFEHLLADIGERLRHCGADRETLVLSAEAIGEDEITATADSDANAKGISSSYSMRSALLPITRRVPSREFHRWDAPGIRWDEKHRAL
jgi:hypothetical protein